MSSGFHCLTNPQQLPASSEFVTLHSDIPSITIATADANRSCGPPKPGAAYENQPDGAASGPSGPDRAPEGPRGRHGVPRGSEHQLCTNTGQSSDPSSDYMLRAALEGTHFFLGENQHAPKIDLFSGFIVTRQTAMPIQIVPRFCARGYGRFEKLLYHCQNTACWDIIGD